MLNTQAVKKIKWSNVEIDGRIRLICSLPVKTEKTDVTY